jgi:hypothetical protein
VKRKLLLWTLTGISIAIGWTAYALATAPDYEIAMSATERAIWALAAITCPPILSGARFYWVIPINGAIYALLGIIVERFGRFPGWIFKATH